MAIETIVTQLAVIQRTISGIKAAYDNTPEVLEDGLLPAFVNVYEGVDVVSPRMMGQREWNHHIRMQLLLSLSADLAVSEKQARPFVYTVVHAFDQDKTANGTAFSVDIKSADYGRIQLVDGGPFYLGINFRTDILEIETVVYAA